MNKTTQQQTLATERVRSADCAGRTLAEDVIDPHTLTPLMRAGKLLDEYDTEELADFGIAQVTCVRA